jgi:hypothetical protein
MAGEKTRGDSIDVVHKPRALACRVIARIFLTAKIKFAFQKVEKVPTNYRTNPIGNLESPGPRAVAIFL